MEDSKPAERIRKAVICTAVDHEIDAVREFARGLQLVSHRGCYFDRGYFDGMHCTWELTIAECGQGNVSTVIVTKDAVEHASPDIVLFVGTAGGIKDVTLGDVVAATHVYCVGGGKSGEEYFHRPRSPEIDSDLNQLAYAIRRGRAWQSRIKFTYAQESKKPRAFNGAIASGDEVVTSHSSASYLFIRKYLEDALVVEKEGYGFLEAVKRYRIPAIVIRGVQDLCKDKAEAEKDGWKERAAAHAAAFAFELLYHFDPPERFFASAEPVIDSAPDESATGQQEVGTPLDERIDLEKTDFEANTKNLAATWRNVVQKPLICLDRSEILELRQKIANSTGEVFCILGVPGSGKTTVIKQLIEDCQSEGYYVLPIKADLIPVDCSFAAWLQQSFSGDRLSVDVIASVAKDRRVVIFLDQLDAIAALVDLSSSRLNDVIEFIGIASQIDNVSIVCSCRNFEFNHDTRFQVLNAVPIQLELPSWEAVSSELTKAGIINVDGMPSEMREVLRNPQHFQLYLRCFKNIDESTAFRSYYSMLDERWNQVINTESRRDVVYELASLSIECESLWVPAVLLESQQQAITDLEAAEILSNDGKKIGFQHQTMLEYVKARLFTRNNQSLCEHVLARQHAVHVRPTIWSVLTYLREADPAKYAYELNGLFQSELRLHVRYLLFDFLGQVLNPSDQEVLQMTSRLAVDDDRKRVLISIQGNPAWFEKLCVTHFASQMALASDQAWPMIGVISQMWGQNRDACLRLIKRNWLPYPEKDELTRRTMTQLEKWDKDAVGVVCTLIRRANVAEDRIWWAEQLVSTISQDQPELAPSVFVETMRRRWNGREPSGYRDGPLTDDKGWYDLPEVAKAAPNAFVKCVWPWFVEQANKHYSDQSSSVLNYYGGGLNDFEIDNTHGNHYIVQAICIALKTAAVENSTEFVEFTGPTWNSESLPLHRMLAQSLEASIEVNAQAALDYLRQDQRRFFLGSYDKGEQYDSCMLVAALGRSLNQADIDELVQLIIAATPYRADIVISEAQRQFEYEARQVLLASLPTDRIDRSVRAEYALGSEDIPQFGHVRSYGRSGFVREIPKLSKEQLEVSTEAEILESVQGPLELERDYSNWIEAEGVFERPGGARAQTMELCELAKENYERVIPLIPKLCQQGSDYTVAELLMSLADSELPAEDAHRLVAELSQLGEASEHFRSNAGYLLYKRSKDGLPTDVLALLHAWLLGPWPSEMSERSNNSNEDRKVESKPSPILWALGGSAVIHSRCYWALRAVTNGYLAKPPANTKNWLELIEQLIDSEISDGSWRLYCDDLRWISIKGCDLVLAESVISKLFQRKPLVAQSAEGVRLIANVAYELSPAFVGSYLNDLKSSEDKWLNQAYGELLALLALRKEPHAWAIEELQTAIQSFLEEPRKFEAVAVGLAFTAAHMWVEPDAQSDCRKILCSLMPPAGDAVGQAIGSVFFMRDNLAVDEDARRLLHSLSLNPKLLSGGFVEQLVDHMVPLAEYLRNEVLNVCELIVAHRGRELLSICHSLYQIGPQLVNIAMTLQRFDDTRSQALELLENLLRIGLADANAVLNENDLKPGPRPATDPPRRRQRRR
ncbi:MAG: AAA family ATPase [Planctomycetales bacterium]|nr:AAA family ATPase [Planctomycetales bacterium]